MKKFLKLLIADLNTKDSDSSVRNSLMAIGAVMFIMGVAIILVHIPSVHIPNVWEGIAATVCGALLLFGSDVTITRKKKDISKNEDVK